MVTDMVVDGYPILTESLTAINRRAKAVKVLRFSTPAKLYAYDPLPERLPQDLQHVTSKLRLFIQAAHAVVRPRHVAGPGEIPAADQPYVRDGMMWGPKQARRDEHRAGTREVSDAVEARGVNGSWEGYRRQDGGAPSRQRSDEDPTLSG